ncbi:MAG: hypothetical protein ACFB2Y_13940 [Fulvivirga sp.]
MKRFSWLFITVLVTIASVRAQKVKYKDLYPLLDSRQYELAIPILKQFLADSKTINHPNANFQLATYFELKTLDQDILKNAEVMDLYADSAITAYQKTMTLLTEKEVSKKNPEYYGAYQRRDVRTGKVGIKLADIQYDLEKKVNSLTERKVAVNNINVAMSDSYTAYTICQRIYSEVRNTYPDTRRLYLQANEEVIKKLDTLAAQAELAVVSAGRMKTALGKIEKAGYDPKIEIKDIEKYEKDGIEEPDYFSDEIVFWEYGNWVKRVKEIVEDKVKPMMANLIEYDNQLNALKDQTLKDSVSQVGKIVSLAPVRDQLHEFDLDPLPLKIFDVKASELEYLAKLVEHHNYYDSADLVYKTELLKEKVKALSQYDSLLNVLADFPYKEESTNYYAYVSNSFGGIEQFTKYIETKKSFADQEFEKKSLELELMQERANWLILDNDSIPLFEVEDIISSRRYLPVVIDSTHTAGLFFEDDNTLKGYFSLVNKSRIPESKVEFAVNEEFFNRINVLDIEALVNADESGQIYHLLFYVPMPEQATFAAELCKIYTADGLAWEKSLILETKPSTITITEGTGAVEVNYDLQSYSGDKRLASGITLDKKGEVLEN